MSDENAKDVHYGLREMLELQDSSDVIAPREAFEVWLRQHEFSECTATSYRYRARPFFRFCEEIGIDGIGELTAPDIEKFEDQRRHPDRTLHLLKVQFETLREWFFYCKKEGAVAEDVYQAWKPPELSRGSRRR
jgi:site-specific recombinase XerD